MFDHDKSEWTSSHPTEKAELKLVCIYPSSLLTASREERSKGKKDKGLNTGKLAALPFPFRHLSLPLFPFKLFAPAKCYALTVGNAIIVGLWAGRAFPSRASSTLAVPLPMASLKSVNILQNTRIFIAAEKWMVRSNGVGGLISLQNRNLRR